MDNNLGCLHQSELRMLEMIVMIHITERTKKLVIQLSDASEYGRAVLDVFAGSVC